MAATVATKAPREAAKIIAPGTKTDLDVVVAAGLDTVETKRTATAVIDLCRDNGIPVFEKNFSLTEVYSAEEAFVTGTFAGVAPVTEIDGRQIGAGARGGMVERLQGLYLALLDAPAG